MFEELEKIPNAARREKSLALVRPLEELEYTREVAEIAEVYLHHKLMPAEALGDADYLALASFYNCDILVTWNCKHLANAEILWRLRPVAERLGHRMPAVCNPLQLMGEIEYED